MQNRATCCWLEELCVKCASFDIPWGFLSQNVRPKRTICIARCCEMGRAWLWWASIPRFSYGREKHECKPNNLQVREGHNSNSICYGNLHRNIKIWDCPWLRRESSPAKLPSSHCNRSSTRLWASPWQDLEKKRIVVSHCVVTHGTMWHASTGLKTFFGLTRHWLPRAVTISLRSD